MFAPSPLRLRCVSLPFMLCLTAALAALAAAAVPSAQAQKRRAEERGATVVVDERLAVLRDGPDLRANALRRLGRGRYVTPTGWKRAPDGLIFYKVMLTSRTGGWLQSEAVVVSSRAGDDARLLNLIRGSEGFDRLARARIFLDLFSRSPLRPMVLMIYGEAAEEAAAKLSSEATRRLDQREMSAGGAPVYSYFLNYQGLDRYNRAGVRFLFDRKTGRFHYDGESWREILRRYPRSREASAARVRLEALGALQVR